MEYNLYIIEHKNGIVKENGKLLLFGEFEGLNYIDDNNLEEAVLRMADKDDIEEGIIYQDKFKEITLNASCFCDEEIQTIMDMVDNWLSMYPGKVVDYDFDIKIKLKNIEWEEE